ncbi:unnamed protein product [Paramecium octaurelia]|uniref:NADH-ubiquinone oxidoreductase 21kDa subunit N-terminal domain-containing protein n=1 Tax=Paramecium octaurelia TaxID=43137 RepID=A0A8S1UWI0_PAROT|nr:unnamed protein product [Paramecium octaurelia]
MSTYRGTFEHDSFLGWLNLFKIRRLQMLYNVGERPPYPVIISKPTVGDVLRNLNKADFGLFATVSFLGFFAARKSTLGLTTTEFVRQRGFSIAWNSIMMAGALFACMNSNNRLTGFVDNGLQWRRKEQRLNKYDFTSEFEEGTIWKFFRLR